MPMARLMEALEETDLTPADPPFYPAARKAVELISAARDTDRDNFMSSAQAKEYGLIDEVLITAKKKPPAVVTVALHRMMT